MFDFPFMFATAEEADAVVDGPFGKMMLDKLDAKNIHGLAYWELGFRNISNSRRPLNKVEDISGLKLRVIPNAINVDWVRRSARIRRRWRSPRSTRRSNRSAIDGQENPVDRDQLANKFHEVQKFLAITNHQYNPQTVIVSKKLWDSLSAGEKKILADAAVEAATFQRKASREQSGAALDHAEEERDAGVRVQRRRDGEIPREDEASRRQAFRRRRPRSREGPAGRAGQGPQVAARSGQGSRRVPSSRAAPSRCGRYWVFIWRTLTRAACTITFIPPTALPVVSLTGTAIERMPSSISWSAIA